MGVQHHFVAFVQWLQRHVYSRGRARPDALSEHQHKLRLKHGFVSRRDVDARSITKANLLPRRAVHPELAVFPGAL